jgi:hypothetical protein
MMPTALSTGAANMTAADSIPIDPRRNLLHAGAMANAAWPLRVFA